MINPCNLKMKPISNGLVALVFSMFMISCSSNPLDVDVSDIELELELDRMERDVFEVNNEDFVLKNEMLLDKYGWLYRSFMVDMLGEVDPENPQAPQALELFVTHPDMQDIYAMMKEKFEDFSLCQYQLEESFRHYKFYFKDSTVPKIVTFYSNFNANAFPYEDRLAIGLEMYLGEENELVQALPTDIFPNYLKQKMDQKYLVADAMKAWLMNKFAPDLSDGDDFLSTIVALGKVMYLLDAMLPEEEDYIKFGCSPEQMEWCRFQEQNIWKTIVDEGVLYSKDKGVILQYVSEGPFTKGMPHESPGRVGVWLGWQIVRDYVEQNEVSVLDLLKPVGAKVILKSYSQGDRE